MNERAWFASSMRQVGDVQMFVNWIIGAVLFTLLFLPETRCRNRWRDRLPELGVLKALGFGNTSIWLLVVAEAMVLSLIAARNRPCNRCDRLSRRLRGVGLRSNSACRRTSTSPVLRSLCCWRC